MHFICVVTCNNAGNYCETKFGHADYCIYLITHHFQDNIWHPLQGTHQSDNLYYLLLKILVILFSARSHERFINGRYDGRHDVRCWNSLQSYVAATHTTSVGFTVRSTLTTDKTCYNVRYDLLISVIDYY